MTSPLVSIGMPVFNDKLFIRKALDSLLSQSHTNFELILSDDCSTDGSAAICKEYAARDSRIQYIRQEFNIGISRNMKFLLNIAKGKYFMWAANDDMWHPDFIQTLMVGLETNPDAVIAFCPVVDIDEDDNFLTEPTGRKTDYSGKDAPTRIKKLISIFDDACGYGLFVREMILDVEFPVWWSVNRGRAFNNIYPTICYYLAKGNYILCGDKPLWFNRIKNPGHIHHKVPYPGSFIKGYGAFVLWKFNVVFNSIKQISVASTSYNTALHVTPHMVWNWFVQPSREAFVARYKSFRQGRMKFW